MGGANNFHHLPFQLLSSGIERLLKCHICYGFLEQNERLPSFNELKNSGGRSGHDIQELLKEITQNYFEQPVLALKDDYTYIISNKRLKTLLELLSEFGKYSRYHNLDIVTGAEKPSRDVESEWRIFETDLALEKEGIVNQLMDINTSAYAIDFINRQVIVLLEKFVRAIARQFTIGQLGKKAQQHSSVLMFYITLKDDDLGTTNYREAITRFKAQKKAPKKRTFIDNLKRKFSSNYVSKKINRSELEGEWAFYHDEIIIECRYGFWCVVTIDGYDYALNGAAQGKYKLEDSHQAGMAKLGVPVNLFIDMCFELWKKK